MPERRRLLARRAAVQRQLDAGWKPDFLPETRAIRDGDWQVAPIPRDLEDRRVEITGPIDRKMVINALNCGANVFMADFEDANTPTWDNLIEGQVNLSDAVRRTIAFDDPQTGRHYSLNGKTAVLLVRPRGWHLPEKHVLVDGEPMSGALFDFGLFFFHNAKELVARGTGPYFYLPKLESHLEARLWNDVFLHAQARLGLPKGTIRATVLIETILAAFEMDEILYELRDHSAGLNCGRWDYIFSFIKKFAEDPNCVMPDRGQVTMTTHFLRSYSLLLIKTCHRREIHAMGGMAAQIPIRDDAAANEAAMEKVRADKQREASDGHDGTWVAHPGLVAIAKEVFDREMPQANQIARKRQDVQVTAVGSSRGSRRHDHRSRAQAEPQCRDRLYRGMAARHRLRAALQSDGGRRHRRNQPRPSLAVDPPRRQARGRPDHRHGAVPQASRRGARKAARVKPKRRLRGSGRALQRTDRGAGFP